MSSSVAIKNALEHYRENELILASKLYREELYDKMTEVAFYKALERMCKSSELAKIAKGTYYLPKQGKYGVVPPSEKEIISAFTENGMGTVVGYSLYNSLNLTTQVAKSIQVMSSALESATKTIKNINIIQNVIKYSEEVKAMIHALEVLQNFYNIQDINYYSFVKFAEKIANDFEWKIFEEVVSKITYKKSTLAFLQEILNYFGKENNLGAYLSKLSEYKYPRMETLYEVARI